MMVIILLLVKIIIVLEVTYSGSKGMLVGVQNWTGKLKTYGK